MQIAFCEKSRVFHLATDHTSYLFQIGPAGELRHLHYGAPVGCDELLTTLAERGGKASFSPNPEGLAPEQALEQIPQEYSGFGSGDMRITAAALRKENGTAVTSTVYSSHRIFDGKPGIPGMPASFAQDGEVKTLEITMLDGFSGARIVLGFSVFAGSDVIARNVRVENATKETIRIERLMSAQLDFHHADFDMLHLKGTWAKERQLVRRRLEPGCQGFRSARGSSGHQYNPAFILADRSATETCGDACSMLLVYSGDYAVNVEADQYGGARAMIGLNDECFRWKLEPGEVFHAPEALIAFSAEGIGGISRASQKFIMDHIIRSPWKHVKRPILVNNWEATYFDFDDDKIFSIAESASRLGIEMLVLDDGWFGKRNDDRTSLGDWFVNREKIKDFGGLVKRINSLGMKFGLWFEPEMISEQSELYKQHPDWIVAVPGFRRSIGRTQMVLDMSRKEVVDHLFETISGILHSANIEYIKWDFNRNLAEIHSAALPADRQPEAGHRYVLGVYDLHERLLREFPNLLIEGCSGGGGRFDAGMLYYVPQIWCSDNSDAIERLSIQLGTSLFYPASAMGAHVSVCPNHQTGRTVSFATRGNVALSGTFGYELDTAKLPAEDAEIVRSQVKQYHRLNDLVREGDFHRLTEGCGTANICAWNIVAPDQSEVLVTAVRKIGHPCGHAPAVHLRLRGLDPDRVYRFADSGQTAHGRTLMNAGFVLPGLVHDGSSALVHLIAER